MESKVNYTIVGIFVVALLAIIIVIALWLSTGLETTAYRTYLVFMNESVAGLSKNAPVKYNGVDVGFVEDIELNLANPQQVILTLKINPDIPITTTTEAVLNEQGITGIAYIGLRGGDHAPPLEAQPGEKYPVIKSSPSFLVRLDTTLQSLTDNISDLSGNIRNLLSRQNLTAVAKTLNNLQKITATIEQNNQAIDASLKNLKIITQNTSKASEEFPDTVKSLQQGANAIKELTQQIRITTNTINKTFKHGDVAVQVITNQLLPQTYQTLDNIEQVTSNLSGLTEELKQNPSIILRGKTAPKPGPGE